MKKISVTYKWVLAASLATAVLVIACGKGFLEKKPLGAYNPDQLVNQDGIEGLLVGAYHMVSGQGGAAANSWGSAASNWVFGSVAADDSYKGSTSSDQGDIVPIETWAYNANNPYFNQKWQAVYDGVQRANDVLRFMARDTTVTADRRKTMSAEARFLRAHFHFEAKKMWNNVPYVDESISVANKNENVPNIDASGNFINIWPKIEADFQYAIDNLPDVQPQKGRANKSAAIAYLAKVLLYQHKYALAKAQLDKIIPAAYGGTGSGKTAGGLE